MNPDSTHSSRSDGEDDPRDAAIAARRTFDANLKKLKTSKFRQLSTRKIDRTLSAGYRYFGVATKLEPVQDGLDRERRTWRDRYAADAVFRQRIDDYAATRAALLASFHAGNTTIQELERLVEKLATDLAVAFDYADATTRDWQPAIKARASEAASAYAFATVQGNWITCGVIATAALIALLIAVIGTLLAVEGESDAQRAGSGVPTVLLGLLVPALIFRIAISTGRNEGMGLVRQLNLGPDFTINVKSDEWNSIVTRADVPLRSREEIEIDLETARAGSATTDVEQGKVDMATQRRLEFELYIRGQFEKLLKQEHSTTTRYVRGVLNLLAGIPPAILTTHAAASLGISLFNIGLWRNAVPIQIYFVQSAVYTGMHARNFPKDNLQKIITSFQIAVMSGRGDFLRADGTVDPSRLDQLFRGPLCTRIDNFRALIEFDLLVYQTYMCALVQSARSRTVVELACRPYCKLARGGAPEDPPSFELYPLWELFSRARQRPNDLRGFIKALLPASDTRRSLLEGTLDDYLDLLEVAEGLKAYKVGSLKAHLANLNAVVRGQIMGALAHPKADFFLDSLVEARAKAEAETNLTSIQQTAHKLGQNFAGIVFGVANTYLIKALSNVVSGLLYALPSEQRAYYLFCLNLTTASISTLFALLGLVMIRSYHEHLVTKAIQRKRDDLKGIRLPYSAVGLDLVRHRITRFDTYVAKPLDMQSVPGLQFDYDSQTDFWSDVWQQMTSFKFGRLSSYMQSIEGGRFVVASDVADAIEKRVRKEVKKLAAAERRHRRPGPDADDPGAVQGGPALPQGGQDAAPGVPVAQVAPADVPFQDRAEHGALGIANMIWSACGLAHRLRPPADDRAPIAGFGALVAWLDGMAGRRAPGLGVGSAGPLFTVRLERADVSKPWPRLRERLTAMGIAGKLGFPAVGLELAATDARPPVFLGTVCGRKHERFSLLPLLPGRVGLLHATSLSDAVAEVLAPLDGTVCHVLLPYRFAALLPGRRPSPQLPDCLYHAQADTRPAHAAALDMLLMYRRRNHDHGDLPALDPKAWKRGFEDLRTTRLADGLRFAFAALEQDADTLSWHTRDALPPLEGLDAAVVALTAFDDQALANASTGQSAPPEKQLRVGLLARGRVYRTWTWVDPRSTELVTFPNLEDLPQALAALLGEQALDAKAWLLACGSAPEPKETELVQAKAPTTLAPRQAPLVGADAPKAPHGQPDARSRGTGLLEEDGAESETVSSEDERRCCIQDGSLAFLSFAAIGPARWSAEPANTTRQPGGVSPRGGEPVDLQVYHELQQASWCGLHATNSMLWREASVAPITPAEYLSEYPDADRVELFKLRDMLAKQIVDIPWAIGVAYLKCTGNLVWSSTPALLDDRCAAVVFTYQGEHRMKDSNAGQHTVCVARDGVDAKRFYLVDSLDPTAYRLAAQDMRSALREAVAQKGRFGAVEVMFMFRGDPQEWELTSKLCDRAGAHLAGDAPDDRCKDVVAAFRAAARQGSQPLIDRYLRLLTLLECEFLRKGEDLQQLVDLVLAACKSALWHALLAACAKVGTSVPLVLRIFSPPAVEPLVVGNDRATTQPDLPGSDRTTTTTTATTTTTTTKTAHANAASSIPLRGADTPRPGGATVKANLDAPTARDPDKPRKKVPKPSGPPHGLQRFLDAHDGRLGDQHTCDLATAKAELAAGRKQSHWMWYVFPQLDGLGSGKGMSKFFSIADLGEAQAYLADRDLGARLATCTRLVLDALASGRTLVQIFGQGDATKFVSCMTLFRQAALASAQKPAAKLFARAIDEGAGGREDALTLAALNLLELPSLPGPDPEGVDG